MILKKSQTTLFLSIIIVMGFLIRLYVAFTYRINPNEASYFYDAKFILDGKTPFKDFSSRSPLYVYSLAVIFHFFKDSYITGRLLSVISSCLSIFFIYLIGKHIDREKFGLLAAFIYSFSPFVFVTDSYGMTQPYQQFFILIGVFLFFKYLKNESIMSLFLCGFFIGAGILVRRSTALFAFTIPIYLWLYYSYVSKESFSHYRGKLIKNTFFLYSGILIIVGPILIYFISITSFESIWYSYGGGMIIQSIPGEKNIQDILIFTSKRAFYLFLPIYIVTYKFIQEVLKGHAILAIRLTFFIIGFGFMFMVLNANPTIFVLYFIIGILLLFIPVKLLNENCQRRFEFPIFLFLLAFTGSMFFRSQAIFPDVILLFIFLLLLTMIPLIEIYRKGIIPEPDDRPIITSSHYESYLGTLIIFISLIFLLLLLRPNNSNFIFIYIAIFLSYHLIYVFKTRKITFFDQYDSKIFFLFLWLFSLTIFYSSYLRWHWYYFSEFNGISCLMTAIFIAKIKDQSKDIPQLTKVIFITIIISAVNAHGYFTHYPIESRIEPEIVQDASDYLKLHTSGDEEVFTGDVSITFEAGRYPAYNMTRPVVYFESSYTRDELHDLKYPTIDELILHLEDTNVKYAVVGPHTKEFYFKRNPDLEDYIYTNYILVKRIENIDILERSTANHSRISQDMDQSTLPSITVDSLDNIYYVWNDHRDDTWEIYCSGFGMSGIRIMNETRITPPSASYSRDPFITTDKDNNIIIVWEEQWTQYSKIFLSKIASDKSSMITHQPIIPTTELDIYSKHPRCIVDSENNIHVLWEKTSSPSGNMDIYYSKLSPNGTKIFDGVQLTDDLGNNIKPSVEIDELDNLHLVWQDGSRADYQIYYTILNGSTTNPEDLIILEPHRISSLGNESTHGRISRDGSRLNIVWQDIDKGIHMVKTIQYLQLDLDGNILINQKPLTEKYPTEEDIEHGRIINSTNPTISSKDGISIVCWQDNRTHPEYNKQYMNIYYKILNVDGNTIVNDTRVSFYGSDSIDPEVVIGGTGAHIVWSDNLPKNYEILHEEIPLP